MKTRELKKEQTRQAILEAALELFKEHGFRQTTLRQIASRVGIALGTTYNYFATKEHIALYFFERALGRVLGRFQAERDEDMALEEELFLLLSLQIEELTPYEEFLGLMVGQVARPSSPLHPTSAEAERLKIRYLDVVAGVVTEAQERGELPVIPLDGMLMNAFWIFDLGMLLFWLNDTSPHKEDTYALLDKTLRFTLEALRQAGDS